MIQKETAMTNVTLAPLTEAETRQFVDEWYKKLDVHAPAEEVFPLVADEDLEMQFPEATLRGKTDFKNWYEGVINIFFDEVHTLEKVDITTTLEQASVQIVLLWEASRWKRPAPKSERLAFTAVQTWILKRSPSSQKPVIVRYIVDSLTPLEGYPEL
jgi:hypothetical protein